MTQDVDGLEAMRSEYTKMSGEDWKTASLGDVMRTLGFCRDLYNRAAILIDGIPNTRVELLNRGIDVSKGKAKEEAQKIITDARDSIQNEKNAAITELKSHVGALSIEIAEKIIQNELSKDEKQKALVDKILDKTNMN